MTYKDKSGKKSVRNRYPKEVPESNVRFSTRYPWDEWFALGEFVLVRERHFHVMVHGMLQNIWKAARTRNIRVKVEVLEQDQIKVTVLPVTEGEES